VRSFLGSAAPQPHEAGGQDAADLAEVGRKVRVGRRCRSAWHRHAATIYRAVHIAKHQIDMAAKGQDEESNGAKTALL
jgi:hypothetical protein